MERKILIAQSFRIKGSLLSDSILVASDFLFSKFTSSVKPACCR